MLINWLPDDFINPVKKKPSQIRAADSKNTEQNLGRERCYRFDLAAIILRSVVVMLLYIGLVHVKSEHCRIGTFVFYQL